MNIELIEKRKISLTEIIDEINTGSSGTVWADTSKNWTIDYIKHLFEVYGDNWFFGYLPKKYLTQILLPRHGNHTDTGEHTEILFELDTPLEQASSAYKKRHNGYDKKCVDNVEFLKTEIKNNGFNSTITLAIINDTLKHADGLHRLLALQLLLEEGFEYKPIPVFLCQS